MNFVKVLRLFCMLLFIAGTFAVGNAQRVKNVNGKYTYVQSADETLSQARTKAIQRARTKAIEDEFGSHVEQTNLTNVSDGQVKFKSFGVSTIKAEWIGDLRDPEFTFAIGKDGERIITVEVWGKAREIVSEKIEIDTHLLRNYPEKKNISQEFREGDTYFVSFRSQMDGYVAIYVLDEDGNASRLLPYEGTKLRCYAVTADKDYIFFSREKLNQGDSEQDVCEYYLTLAPKKNVEYNQVLVLFSPNEFIDPDDTLNKRVEASHILPPMVSQENMQRWLVKNRSRDKYMQVIELPMTIKSKI